MASAVPISRDLGQSFSMRPAPLEGELNRSPPKSLEQSGAGALKPRPSLPGSPILLPYSVSAQKGFFVRCARSKMACQGARNLLSSGSEHCKALVRQLSISPPLQRQAKSKVAASPRRFAAFRFITYTKRGRKTRQRPPTSRPRVSRGPPKSCWLVHIVNSRMRNIDRRLGLFLERRKVLTCFDPGLAGTCFGVSLHPPPRQERTREDSNLQINAGCHPTRRVNRATPPPLGRWSHASRGQALKSRFQLAPCHHPNGLKDTMTGEISGSKAVALGEEVRECCLGNSRRRSPNHGLVASTPSSCHAAFASDF